MPFLTITIDGEKRRFDVSADKPVFLGRAKECDIVLMSPGVSRRHAMIIARAGICGIKDLDSFNGTFLNGSPVAEPAMLKDGDVIRISSFDIVFSLEPADSPEKDASDVPEADIVSSPRLLLPRAMTDIVASRTPSGDAHTKKKSILAKMDIATEESSIETILETIQEKPPPKSGKTE